MLKLSTLLLLLSFLALIGCQNEPPIVEVDTTPIGSGLATIGIGLVLAAFIGAACSGGDGSDEGGGK
jgi:hypothetical protein